jgi:N-acetylglucosamine-6-phosphate deacetylase
VGGLVVIGAEMVSTDVTVRGAMIAGIELNRTGAGRSLDASGLTLLPGFVDIHVHGGGGQSFFTRDPERIAAYSRWAPANGVTSFLVSLVGNNPDDTCAMLDALRPALDGAATGAQPLGFHLEGPFISPVRKGAFPESVLRSPALDEFQRYQHAAGGAIRQVTIAPELPGALEVAEAAVASGCRAAMGHTDATYEQASRGLDGPISHVTHLFNAMRPVHHREGGPIVATLESSATCELIFDGEHVSPEVLRVAYRVLGDTRAVVVTDNLYLAGAARTSGTFAGGTVSAEGAVARREDSTIVGSLLPFQRHFRNAIQFLGIDLVQAARLCANNAARVIGAAGRGEISPGAFADLVLLDRQREVVATVCAGALAYLRPGDEWRYSP